MGIPHNSKDSLPQPPQLQSTEHLIGFLLARSLLEERKRLHSKKKPAAMRLTSEIRFAGNIFKCYQRLFHIEFYTFL